MLADIQPDLKNIAHGHAVFRDGAAKNALTVPRNPHVEVGFFFCIPRKGRGPSERQRSNAPDKDMALPRAQIPMPSASAASNNPRHMRGRGDES